VTYLPEQAVALPRVVAAILAQEGGSTEAVRVAEAVGALTGPAVLGLVLLLVLFGYLVPRGHVEELRRDRDTWQTLALQAINLGEAAVRRGEHR
jgi:Na+/H+-translocating membrane pyrophosphatase